MKIETLELEKKLSFITEVNMIHKLIGTQLINEGVIDDVVELFLRKVKPGGSAIVDAGITDLRRKVRMAASSTPPRLLRLQDIIYDLEKIAKDPYYAEIIGKDIMMKLYPELEKLIDDTISGINVKDLSPDEIKGILNDAIDTYNQGRALPVWYPQLKELVLNKRHIAKIKNVKTSLQRLVDFVTPESMKLFSRLVYNVRASQESLQKKFIEASDSAVKKIEQGLDADQEFKEMFALLGATKKSFDNKPKYILDKWLEDPFFKNNPKAAQEFRAFLEGDLEYKELYQSLLKKNPNLIGGAQEGMSNWLERYRSLWPFKHPKTPGGKWIFSDKFSASRAAGFLALKSAKSVTDLNKYLLSRGVKGGLIKMVTFRFLYIYVILPIIVAHIKGLIESSEKYIGNPISNLLGKGDVDWVDFSGDAWDQAFKDSYLFAVLLGQAVLSPYGLWDFVDRSTYINEVYGFYDKFLRKGGGDVDKEAQESKKRVIDDVRFQVPTDTVRVLETGQIPINTGEN